MKCISFSGKTLNVTGYAQVRFRLACQQCICYLLPVNGLICLPASLREGGGFCEAKDGRSLRAAFIL